MLVFDQLKKNDPQLRLLTAAVLLGLCILVAGLWWVQIVSAQDYQQHLETQAFRTVRIPAVRGLRSGSPGPGRHKPVIRQRWSCLRGSSPIGMHRV